MNSTKESPTRQVSLKANNIFRKYKLNENIEEMEHNIKFELHAKDQCLSRYTKTSNHNQQNKLFNEEILLSDK
jgi:hypothetical protein